MGAFVDFSLGEFFGVIQTRFHAEVVIALGAIPGDMVREGLEVVILGTTFWANVKRNLSLLRNL